MTQSTACCTAITNIPATTCEKTQGPFGEIVSSDAQNVAITATEPIIPVPVDPTTVR